MWQFAFWFSIAVIAYTYLGYPLILFISARLTRRRPAQREMNGYPSVSLIISAFNEEKVIREKIENSFGLDYPRDRLTVVLASDGSDDGTVAIAREYTLRGLKVFHYPRRSGKSEVLNRVMKDITSDIVVFTDANALFATDALERLVRHFADPRIGSVVGKLRYVEDNASAVGKGEGAYWKYEGILSVLESALGTVLVANGSIFAIRRQLFVDLYPEVANDFQLPTEVASQGYDVVYEAEALALEPCTYFWREEFERKVRIVLRGLTGFQRLTDKFRGFRLWQFWTHKLMRWLMTPFLCIVLLSNTLLAGHSWFYTTTFVLQLAFYAAALNGWRMRRQRKSHPVSYIPFYFTMVNLAAVRAFARFLSGDRQAVWEKAESARVAPAVFQDPLRVDEPHFAEVTAGESDVEADERAERIAKS
jgi:cellulose synthase/poly-beta-1,6-N-acetylglucosamine synthase-like glycosyltransferase